MAAKKPKKDKDDGTLIEELEKALAEELKKIANDPDATLTDKAKVWDRVLKLCAIKLKIDDENESSGFDD